MIYPFVPLEKCVQKFKGLPSSEPREDLAEEVRWSVLNPSSFECRKTCRPVAWEQGTSSQWLRSCHPNFFSHWVKWGLCWVWGHVFGGIWRRKAGAMAVAPSGLKYFLCGLVMASPVDSRTECMGEGRSRDVHRVKQCYIVLSPCSEDQLVNFDFGLSGGDIGHPWNSWPWEEVTDVLSVLGVHLTPAASRDVS